MQSKIFPKDIFERIERERRVEIMSEKDVIEVTVSILVSI